MDRAEGGRCGTGRAEERRKRCRGGGGVGGCSGWGAGIIGGGGGSSSGVGRNGVWENGVAGDVGMAWRNLFVSPAAAKEAETHDECSHSQHPNYEAEDLGGLPNVTHSFFFLPLEILGWKRVRGR